MSDDAIPFLRPRQQPPLNLPVWVSPGTIADLAELIGVAIYSGARDQNGLKILAPVQFSALQDIAREAMRQAIGATHLVQIGEPDPAMEDGWVIFRILKTEQGA